MKYHLFALILLLSVLSCRQKEVEETIAPTYSGRLNINLNHLVDTNVLHLDTSWYVNAAGDSMRVSLFRYYISNIKLLNGTQSWSINNSYFLVDESMPLTKTIQLKNLPETEYDGIEFIIGVDSARNMSGAQTGALDPQNDMFWGWASGYIFFKAEGYYRDSLERGFSIHVGGFKYPNNAIRKATVSFGSQKLYLGAGLKQLNLKTDLNQMFKTPLTVSLKNIYSIHEAGANAVKYADNYADMFSFGSIQ